MPFTPAHPAIVLPLLKVNPRYLSATALVIGSVAPDFEYFFKMAVNSEYSHTLPGLFYFDLPITLFLSFVFHLLIKQNLIDNCPKFIQVRLQSLREFDFIRYLKNNYTAFVIAALIGSGSHILWDNFTHGDGFFVENLPLIYEGTKVPFQGVRYPVWYALQHISTGVGLLAVVLYIAFMKVDSSLTVNKPVFQYWILIAIISVLIVGVRFRFDLNSASFGNFIVSCISALCISLLIAGLIRFKSTSTLPDNG